MKEKGNIKKPAVPKSKTGYVKVEATERKSKGVKVAPLDWSRLLSTARVEGPDRKKSIYESINDHRTPHERDFDRAVFCTPVRRLKDKTQVFPLDMHDGVRTRLTHSMEVSNLARSMGTAVSAAMSRISRTMAASSANISPCRSNVSTSRHPDGFHGITLRSWRG